MQIVWPLTKRVTLPLMGYKVQKVTLRPVSQVLKGKAKGNNT